MPNDPLTEARFWAQVTRDAERRVYCPPVRKAEIEAWVAAAGLDHLITVKAHPYLGDMVVEVDEQAFQAEQNRIAQTMPLLRQFLADFPKGSANGRASHQ